MSVPSILRWRGRPSPRAASTSLLAVATLGLLAAMVLSDGYRSRTYELEESSVWVTSETHRAAGRINTQIGAQEDTFGVARDASSPGLDVHQDGRSVLVQTGQQLIRVEASTVTEASRIALFEGAQVDVAGGLAVVSDPATGRVWSQEVEDFTALDVEAEAPLFELGPVAVGSVDPGAVVAVGPDGTVAGYSAENRDLTVVPRDGERRVVHVDDVGPEDVQVSLAGDVPLLLDRTGSQLFAEGQPPVDLTTFAGPLELQLPGDDPTTALIASPTGLISVDVREGKATSVETTEATAGTPIRPVRLAGCNYSAWTGAGTATELIGCADWDEPAVVDLATVTDADSTGLSGELRFRTNRRNVVLNVLESGQAFQLSDRTLTRVDDWTQQHDGNPEDQPEDGDPQVAGVEEEQQPPTAEPDDLGTRPERSTVLAVLDNDSDPNGDPLMVVALDGLPSADVAGVSIVRNGQAVQIRAAAGTEGQTISFRYAISDGAPVHRDPVWATVTVDVRAENENSPPELRRDADGEPRKPSMTISSGATASYDVLSDWTDFDGDPLLLTSAAIASPPAAESGDAVQWVPDGSVTFVDGGAQHGAKRVAATVSDSRVEAEGSLAVDVQPSADALAPLARPDVARTTVNTPVTVHPLLNDFSGRGSPLRLAELMIDDLPAGVTALADHASGTVAFVASEAGSFSFAYSVSDGTGQASARIRVEVVAQQERNRPPTPSMDVVVVPLGGSRTVDLLLNDVDPDGDVLAVTAAESAPQLGVTTTLGEYRRLTVVLERKLSAPVRLEYQVTDGANAPVSETVLVVMAPDAAQGQPPQTRLDRAVVRVGDVVDIAVLVNDIDPAGGLLSLDPVLAEPPSAGVAVVADAVVRYQAPDAAATVRIGYVAIGSNGLRTRGSVEIDVRSDESNTPPVPPSLDSRVVSGRRVTIPVPLTGVDPDGDSVVLVGLASAPTSGRIVMPVGADSMVYEASEDAPPSLDEFSYRVRDRRGLEGVGQVRVLVLPERANEAPVAMDDEIELPPGAQVRLAALANDRDPDGDPISFDTARPLEAMAGISAEFDGDRLLLRAGDAEGSFAVSYHISDGEGVSARPGVVSVRVRAGATGLPPIAWDDEGLPTPGADRVTLRPADNDIDPDGDSSTLSVSLPQGHPAWASASDGREVTAELGAAPRSLAYTVTDVQQNSTIGFIRLPPIGAVANRPPEVIPGAPPLQVRAGEVLPISLGDHVRDPEGAAVRLTGGSKVTATRGDGTTSLWVDETKLQYRAAADTVGEAAISFEVTDGVGADAGRITVLTLPITVLPPEGTNPPPQVRGVPTLSLTRGGPERTIDLARFARDVGDETNLRWSREVEGAPDGVSASIQGSVMTVSAGAGATATAATLTYTVRDEDNSTTGTVTIEITDQVTDPPRAVADEATTNAGEAITIRNVIGNDLPTGGVKLLEVVPDSSGTAERSGNDVVYTPNKPFAGTAQLAYTIRETGGQERTAQGVIRVRVRAAPAAPSAPRLVARTSGRVELTWDAPDARGSTITGYQLDWGGGSKECERTTCVVDGLQNGTEYRFRVRAHSDVTDSEFGAWSMPVTPDAVPDPPTGVTLKFDPALPDGRLVASWNAPSPTSSAVQSYRLVLSPAAPGGPVVLEGSGSSHVLTGLQNGVPYTLRLEALNQAGASAPSAASAPDSPAGVPDPPGVPTVVSIDGDAGTATVSWTPPAFDGGRPITGYSVSVYADGEMVGAPREVTDPSQSSLDLTGIEAGKRYSFAVHGRNSVGYSGESVMSPPLMAVGAPGAVGPLSVRVTGNEGEFELQFVPPETNGHVLTGYRLRTRYLWFPVSWQGSGQPVALDQRVFTSPNPGWGQDVFLYPCYEGLVCDEHWSDPLAGKSPEFVPAGPPGRPTITAMDVEGSEVVLRVGSPRVGVLFGYSDAPILGYRYSVEYQQGPPEWRDVVGGEIRLPYRPGASVYVCFVAVNKFGQGTGKFMQECLAAEVGAPA